MTEKQLRKYSKGVIYYVSAQAIARDAANYFWNADNENRKLRASVEIYGELFSKTWGQHFKSVFNDDEFLKNWFVTKMNFFDVSEEERDLVIDSFALNEDELSDRVEIYYRP